MAKIIVDIVSPYGGREGGIEDVIRAWTKNLNMDLFDLRVMHMTPGIAYLDGYTKAYFLKGDSENVDPSYCASGYNLFLSELGAPDICIATNTPFMTLSCDKVRNHIGSNMVLFSWVHSEIQRYEERGQGGIDEMLCADRHLVINSSMEHEIHAKSPEAIIYDVGNPILHELPNVTTPPIPNKMAYVGRLSEEKRLDIVLEAMYKAKSDWMLDIIGDGPIRNEIEGWIKLLKLDNRVRILGWKNNPLEYITDASFLICASDFEGFMIAGAEALAMGKPVIATPTQGLMEYLKDSENGYFFNFGDADSLVAILDDISSRKKAIPDSEICRNTVNRFMSENYFKTIENILLNSVKK